MHAMDASWNEIGALMTEIIEEPWARAIATFGMDEGGRRVRFGYTRPRGEGMRVLNPFFEPALAERLFAAFDRLEREANREFARAQLTFRRDGRVELDTTAPDPADQPVITGSRSPITSLASV